MPFYLLMLLFPTLAVLGFFATIFKRAARRLGLEREGRGYAGEIEGLRVSLGLTDGRAGSPFAIRISAPAMLGSVSLEKHAMAAPRPVDRIDTGDREFDEGMNLATHPATGMAILDRDTRELVMSMRRRGYLRVYGGEIQIVPGGILTARKVVGLVFDAVELARRWSIAPGELPARLAAVARGDDEVVVRRRAFAALVSAHLEDPVTREACDAVGAQDDLAMRMIAAVALRQEGALEAALASGEPCVRDTGIAVMARRGETPSTEALVLALEHAPPEHLAMSLVRVLERAGTGIALAPLARVAKQVDSGLGAAIEAALVAIRSRTNLAESTGALSLAPGTGGEVSIAGDARGALSEPTDG